MKISGNSETGRQQAQIQFGTFAKFYFKLSGEKQKVMFSDFSRHTFCFFPFLERRIFLMFQVGVIYFLLRMEEGCFQNQVFLFCRTGQ